MANWDSYTQKSTPEDADTLMIKDTAGAANKRTPFSGVWNWIVRKLTSAVVSQLETSNKSIIPAINELNSKSRFEQTDPDLDTLQDSNQHIVVGVLTTNADGKYPEPGIFVHIKANSYALSQFIFTANDKMFHRRYVSGKWNTWYEYTGTSWTQST